MNIKQAVKCGINQKIVKNATKKDHAERKKISLRYASDVARTLIEMFG